MEALHQLLQLPTNFDALRSRLPHVGFCISSAARPLNQMPNMLRGDQGVTQVFIAARIVGPLQDTEFNARIDLGDRLAHLMTQEHRELAQPGRKVVNFAFSCARRR